jgi:heptosyltransferase-3
VVRRSTISNDTGPMHLSYAVGTPVIALFSSRDFPGIWYPPQDGYNVVIRAKSDRLGIGLPLEEDLKTGNMQSIEVDPVVQAALELNEKLRVE